MVVAGLLYIYFSLSFGQSRLLICLFAVARLSVPMFHLPQGLAHLTQNCYGGYCNDERVLGDLTMTDAHVIFAILVKQIVPIILLVLVAYAARHKRGLSMRLLHLLRQQEGSIVEQKVAHFGNQRDLPII